MTLNNNGKWIVRTLVPDEVYTDRSEFLDYFYEEALEAAHRRAMSTVLLGQRRMGKTEIFKRVVNRLFFEQDPNDPRAVVPVYYSFSDGLTDRKDGLGSNFARGLWLPTHCFRIPFFKFKELLSIAHHAQPI